MKISIVILIIVLAVYIWYLKAENKPKIEPQATLLPDVATHHSVNGKWIEAEEMEIE